MYPTRSSKEMSSFAGAPSPGGRSLWLVDYGAIVLRVVLPGPAPHENLAVVEVQPYAIARHLAYRRSQLLSFRPVSWYRPAPVATPRAAGVRSGVSDASGGRRICVW